MIRKDFISKYVQELAKMLAKLMDLTLENNEEDFTHYFGEMLNNYYKIAPHQLALLLEVDQERDQFLLADELKKKNTLVFCDAALMYSSLGKNEQAETAFKIVERIQAMNHGIFQFPTAEDQLITTKINTLKETLKVN